MTHGLSFILLLQDSYEINSDSEAALAKELAKLLTNELLNYKMNLMPDTVKQVSPHSLAPRLSPNSDCDRTQQAMKDHGIGIINQMMNN